MPSLHYCAAIGWSGSSPRRADQRAAFTEPTNAGPIANVRRLKRFLSADWSCLRAAQSIAFEGAATERSWYLGLISKRA